LTIYGAAREQKKMAGVFAGKTAATVSKQGKEEGPKFSASNLGAKEFKFGCYKECAYSAVNFGSDGEAGMGALLAAIKKKEYETASQIAAYMLATTTREDGVGEDGTVKRTKTFVEVVQEHEGTLVPTASTELKDDDAATFVTENAAKPGYKAFCLSLACYTIGFGARGQASKVNQTTGRRWLSNVKAISGFSARVPEWVNFSSDILSSDSNSVKLGLGAVLYLTEDPQLSVVLGDSPTYGIIRPTCAQYLTIFRRYLDIDREFPGFLFDVKVLDSEELLHAAIVVLEIGKLMVEKPERAMEIWAIRGIDSRYLQYLSDFGARKGATAMYFASCWALGDDQGGEAWVAFEKNDWTRQVMYDKERRDYVAGYVDFLKAQRAERDFGKSGIQKVDTSNFGRAARERLGGTPSGASAAPTIAAAPAVTEAMMNRARGLFDSDPR
ncbi:N, partial [Dog Tick rhabdovirus-1]